MYFPNALLFGAATQHSEPARLMLTRKLREFSEYKSTMTAEIGTIDVEVIEDIAIASYPYRFRLTKKNVDGSVLELDVPYACGTQVFKEDGSGVPRIIHEHLGTSEPGKKTLHARGSVALGSSPSAEPLPHNLGPTPSEWIAPSAFTDIERVREIVHKYWKHYCNCSAEDLLAMYVPTASVIAAGARRSEPARLAIARRQRELFGQGASVQAQPGTIDVQPITAEVAIASYSFHFNLIKVFANGKRFSIDMPNARATQVFRRDEEGLVRIIHEHMSTPKNGVYKELAAPELAFKSSSLN
jgi:ketosteroid isomerase-like protein